MKGEAAPPVIRSMGRYGEAGPWHVNLGQHSPFVADPDPTKWPRPTIADRYTATARTRRDRPGALASVTMTERETGATFGWNARGNRVTMTFPSDETAANVLGLWTDGHVALGLARQQTGGPPVDSGLRWEAIVDALVASHDQTGGWATEDHLAKTLGYTERWLRRIAARAPGPPDRKPYERVLAVAQERVHRRGISSG